MDPHRPSRRSRRRVLAGAGALLATLAGCEGSPPDADANREPDVSPGRRSDPPHAMVRVADGGSAVYRIREERDGTTTRVERGHGIVASTAGYEELRFADVDGVAGARGLLEATDFGAESVFYVQGAIDECYRRELCYVGWTARSVEIRFADVLRAATAACEVDGRDGHATFVRIPEPLDPDRVSNFSAGHSRGRGGCERFDEQRSDVASGTGPARRTATGTGGNE